MNKIELVSEFTENGLECYVLSMDLMFIGGFHNGYVALPKGHKYYGEDYYDIDVDAHGGLTYADNYLQDVITKEDELWVIGFDTNHYDDTEHTQSLDYVIEATKKLARQL